MTTFRASGEAVDVYRDAVRNRIVVAPQGAWTTATAELAIAEVNRQLALGPAHFVADVRLLERYQSVVREAWQREFSAHRQEFLSFTFVGKATPLVKMGIAAMSLFLRQSFTIVDELDGLRPARAVSSKGPSAT